MYDIHVGEQKSLMFPIMCNAYVSIGYDDNIPDVESTPSDTTDDIPYGLWAHEGDFSFEAIVTPYDINGEALPRDRNNSVPDKVMPNGVTSGSSQSNFTLSKTGDGRLNHEMIILHNTRFSVSLVNTTTTTINQPAEYKIRVAFHDGPTVNIDSSTIITASKERLSNLGNLKYNSQIDGFDENGYRVFDNIGQNSLVTSSSGQTDINISLNSAISGDYTNYLPVGSELFTRDDFTYTSLGTILSFPSGNVVRMSQNLTTTLTNGVQLYVESFKEPKYIENTHHIAVSYLEIGKFVNIFYNGNLVCSGTRNSATDAFVFERDDFLIGRVNTDNTNLSNYAYTAKQFMGEIHEMCFENAYKNKYTNTNTLLPKFNETLLYLRFEEVDL